MFKTMDGVQVYDKADVDGIIEPIQQNAAEAKQESTALATRKLDKSEANLEFAADRQRLNALETGKANKSEVPGMVQQTIDSVINSKLALIESDINHIVDNKVDTELQSYDNSTTVNDKIAAAVATRPVAMTTAEATAIVDQHF